MAGDSTGMILKLGLVGGAGYLAYKFFFAAPAPTGDLVVHPPGGATPPAAAPPAAPGYNSPSALLARIDALAKADNITTATPDVFNVYFVRAGGPGPAPDPVGLFGGRDPMTLAEYWAGMSRWLATEKGLTGFGVYAGLGALMFRRAR